MSAHKGFVVVDSVSNVLLSAPMSVMKESVATKVANDMGGNAVAVELAGMDAPWDPAASPAQVWEYDAATKRLSLS